MRIVRLQAWCDREAAQISSSTSHTRKPSSCVLPLMQETKLHIQTKQQATL